MALTNKLTAIANAIRSKSGKTGSLTLDQMVTEINALETGGNALKQLLDQSKSCAHMFNGYKGTTLDLTMFNGAMGSVTTMYNMFSNCTNLTSVNLNNFDTGNVTNMGSLFSNCSNLTTLDLRTFKTDKVTNMSFMFSGCSELKTLDLRGFDTSKVTNMSTMFYKCTSLTTLKIGRSADTSPQPLAGSDLFSSCPSTMKIYVPSNLVDAYKTATYWSTYADRIVAQ